MFRRYSWAALALAAVACGDSGDKDSSDAGSSSGTDGGAAVDASIPVTAAASTETGKTCTAASECGGVSGKAQCLTTVGQAGGILPSFDFPEGYCSAQCTEDIECNPSGGTAAGCPGGTAIKQAQTMLAGLGPAASFLLPQIQQISVCLESCTGTGTSTCRDGYECVSLKDRLTAAIPAGGDAGTTGGGGGTFNAGALIGGFIGPGNFCLPMMAATDAGTPPAGDASTGTTDAGSDAGTDATDAGAESDAGDAG